MSALVLMLILVCRQVEITASIRISGTSTVISSGSKEIMFVSYLRVLSFCGEGYYSYSYYSNSVVVKDGS